MRNPTSCVQKTIIITLNPVVIFDIPHLDVLSFLKEGRAAVPYIRAHSLLIHFLLAAQSHDACANS